MGDGPRRIEGLHGIVRRRTTEECDQSDEKSSGGYPTHEAQPPGQRLVQLRAASAGYRDR